jgi:2-amino-4-hydroxy-6-hydroxymethyldihydropteridine diphosphokinase
MLTYLSLGSNLGDRRRNLSLAATRLALMEGVELVRLSSVYETAPWGDEDQPAFLNMVVAARVELEPGELLRRVKALEAALGREETRRWGPRVVDVDILLYGDERVDTAGLTIPHAHMRERQFVLVPLAEVAPELEEAGLARDDGEEVSLVGRIGENRLRP